LHKKALYEDTKLFLFKDANKNLSQASYKLFKYSNG